MNGYQFHPEATIVQSHLTGKDVRMTIVAEGDWSGRDMELLYELIGFSLRNGAYDPIHSSRHKGDL